MPILKIPTVVKGPATHTPAGGVAPQTRRTHAANIAVHQHKALHGHVSTLRRMPVGKFK